MSSLRRSAPVWRALRPQCLPHPILTALLLLSSSLGLAGCSSESTGNPSTAGGKTGTNPATSTSTTTARPATTVGAGAAVPKLSAAQEPSPFRFTEVLKDSGIDFVHVSGMTPERYFPTANGSGVAILDYDGDGKLDLYFLSNTFLPLGSSAEGQNRLYRNLGDWKFEDVTEKSGLGYHGFCHGAIVGDYDNDGDPDVFIATYHQNTLFLNNGDGTFRNVGLEAGVAPSGFRGRILGGGTGTEPITIDAVDGLKWRVNGGEPTDDLTVKVKKGQKLVFRQADSQAPRGVELLANPGAFIKIGEADKPGALLREVGPEGASRLYRAVPPVASGAEPVVLAEFEVVQEIDRPLGFECSEHRTAWSSGGAPLDYDNDGDLDFYVTNYGWWTVEEHGAQFCGNRERNVRQYCSPKEVTTVRHILYRNDGVKDGIPRFTDVTDEAGVNRSDGHGFGVVASDLNEDGLIDLYVANDQNPAFTYYNNGDGTFTDATEINSAAYDEKGAPQSGMGADSADVDGDGKPELYRTNFANEYNTLYQNLGQGMFYDMTAAYGLAGDAMPWVGWGCQLADFDNDGWPDSFVTNGHVDDNYHLIGINNIPYEEPPLLHRNTGQGNARRFKLATKGAGAYFETGHVGRGAAFGDIDNDGDIDIVVNHKGGAPGLLRNDTPGENRWIRLKLQGTRANRDAIGARVEVVADGRTITRFLKGGCSMESSNDPRLLIGVGPVQKLETVIIHWPAAKGQEHETVLKDVPTNAEQAVVEPAS